MKRIKVLNLYAGIGGNRKLWPNNIEVTAIENRKEIARIYKDYFPEDKVLVTDAHQYLLDHYKEFDFIWSSPPCPSHSRMRLLKMEQEGTIPKYPDIKLYEEILFLKHFFKGKWVIENVISYYQPLIVPFKSNNHYYWSNCHIQNKKNESRNILNSRSRTIKSTVEGNILKQKEFSFDLSVYNLSNTFKQKILNNCVTPKMGLFVWNCCYKTKQQTLE